VETPNDTIGLVPLPERLTVWGLLRALSVKFSEALRFPVADGVNVTLTAQVLVGVTVAPEQVSALLPKSLAFVPPIVAGEKMRLAVPVFVTVTVCGVLVTSIFWGLNVRLVGEKVTGVAAATVMVVVPETLELYLPSPGYFASTRCVPAPPGAMPLAFAVAVRFSVSSTVAVLS